MSRFYLFVAVSVLLSKAVFCHEENVKILEELEVKVGTIKEGQDTIRSGIKSLEDYFLEEFKKLSTSEKSRDEKEEPTEPEDAVTSLEVKQYVDRLDKLEKNIEAIQSYVNSERETDYFLRGLTGDIGKAFDADMIQVKNLAAGMKKELTDSLGNVNNELKAVEDFANSRNVIIGGVLYYDGIGSPCGPSFDVCRVDKSECRDGKCQCVPGLSHDSLHEECVETCEDGYGNTYQTVHNYIIRGNNNAILNETSLEECKEHCETEESFNCRSFDYFPRWDSCFLSENVKSDAEDAWEYNSAGIHFQRDCIIDKQ